MIYSNKVVSEVELMLSGKAYYNVFPPLGAVPPGQEWALKVVAQVEESDCQRLTSGEEDMNGRLNARALGQS